MGTQLSTFFNSKQKGLPQIEEPTANEKEFCIWNMQEPQAGLEPATSTLQEWRSTIELLGRFVALPWFEQRLNAPKTFVLTVTL